MLSNCKISKYKIKNILKCFSQDYTSIEASRILKLNRKTTDRYYKLFSKIVLLLIIDMIEASSQHGGIYGHIKGKYLGCVRGEYGPKACLKIYKVNKKLFLFKKVEEEPNTIINMVNDEDFADALKFVYKRFSKRYGFAEQSYFDQLYESSVKYNYSPEELYDVMWKKISKLSKKKTIK